MLVRILKGTGLVEGENQAVSVLFRTLVPVSVGEVFTTGSKEWMTGGLVEINASVPWSW